jgi:hypothetical protein
MATNPDSIERDPTPIARALKTTVRKVSTLRHVLLLGIIAGVISTAPDPWGLFGSVLVTIYATVEGRK